MVRLLLTLFLALLTLTGCLVELAPVPTRVAPATGVVAPFPTGPAPHLPAGVTTAQLVRVIDGDTLDVRIGGMVERVRYIGVDTPERGQPGYRAATEANRALVGRGPVYLVRDVSDRDRTSDRRLLRYVYNAYGMLVEAELVAGGWAQPVEYPPDVKLAAHLRMLAVQAAREGRGFWAPTPPADGAMPYGLTTGAAAVRRGPGANFEVSTRLAPDTPLTVYGRNATGDWLQVRTPDRVGGWIDARVVRLNVPVQQVPLAQG